MTLRTVIFGAALIIAANLSACKTTDTDLEQVPQNGSTGNSSTQTVPSHPTPAQPISPQISTPQSLPNVSAQGTGSDSTQLEGENVNPVPVPTYENVLNFVTVGGNRISFSDYLPGWQSADLRPALNAFSRNCSAWKKRDAETALMISKPEFGRYQDWNDLCQSIPSAPYDERLARWFFETYFLPANLVRADRPEGLLTGYYEPEIEVRPQIDAEFFEPILAYPKANKLQDKTRAEIYRNQVNYKIHAYGRPIDVFFMQVQGSGRLRYADGTVKRAAYGGNNGHKYKSIGSVLIRRGEMTREQSSKQAIEDWMTRAGHLAARDLINENPRYIYFTLEDIQPDEGPKGALGVPLTAMGSLAIDPKSRPYGVPVWLETVLPQFSGDYNGMPQSLLVIAQDTGSAIRGETRGDLFFGSGDYAGELAGVMKHDVVMTHLLPRNLVLSQLGLR